MTFFLGIMALILCNIIKPTDVLHGFANEQLAVIVLLLILSDMLRKSSAVETVFNFVFHRDDHPNKFLIKIMSVVGLCSAFFNNTPLVAMTMPYVYSWSKENNLSPSRFLMPLSYASILGGCMTLIGTSTILIVNGMAVEAGFESLDLFSTSIVGGAMFLIGTIYMMTIGQKLLPKHDNLFASSKETGRRYFMQANISLDSSLAGKSIHDAGLRNLDNLFLVEIIREDRTIRPVSPAEKLHPGDQLFFAGEVDAIATLSGKEGIEFPDHLHKGGNVEPALVEVVVSHNSVLANQEVRSTNFRGRYDGAILAIHRNGEKLWGHLGKIRLKAGDVLLVLAGNDFDTRSQSNSGFYVISNFRKDPDINVIKVLTIFFGMIGAIVLTALNVFSLLNSLLILFTVSMLMKIAKPGEIRRSIDFSLILIIGLGLALGKGMENSGAADLLAQSITGIHHEIGMLGLMIVLFVITNGLSSIVTSKAAVAVTLPVVFGLVRKMGLEPEPFILLIAFAGAANFATPIGYQTNLMVFGPGGYSFKDFVRVGLPLTVIYMVVCVGLLGYTYNLI